jgi:hexosaminidase
MDRKRGKLVPLADNDDKLGIRVPGTLQACNKINENEAIRMQEICIVPRPQQLTPLEGTFELGCATRILVSESTRAVGEYLQELLQTATGYPLPVMENADGIGAYHTILLTTSKADAFLGAEGYELSVTPGGVVLRAPHPAGLFYGVQSLRQLLPPEIESSTIVHGVAWVAPAVTIRDRPRFAWRGMMLDTGRHMFPPAFIKRTIDLMAMQKMNVFHWHLTEDQGWRIEIKKYPRLTATGAWRAASPQVGEMEEPNGIPYGGFYTQRQIHEIEAYATSRFIKVVPEIEMPGHAVAALASYPKLGCTGGPYAVRTSWGIAEDVFCAGNEATFAFLEDVLGEVLALFPGEFIHIGGDECPKQRWKACPKCQAAILEHGLKDEEGLQSYFVQRMERFLNAQGRRMIGWDEILEGGLAPNATVMSWRGMQGGLAAVQAGHDVVMCPTSHCYLDYPQTQAADETLPDWMDYTPLEKSYAFEPVPSSLTPAEATHILGAQANLWSEFIPSEARAEAMLYPRASALAERMWSDAGSRDFEEFSRRLGQGLLPHLEILGVNFWKAGPTGGKRG